jgi:hypothetical protein
MSGMSESVPPPVRKGDLQALQELAQPRVVAPAPGIIEVDLPPMRTDTGVYVKHQILGGHVNDMDRSVRQSCPTSSRHLNARNAGID